PEGLGFLAPAGEDERVTALETDNVLTDATALDEKGVDVGLAHARVPGKLPHADALGVGRRQVEEGGHGEAVVDDDVGAAQHLGAPDGEEARIAGPGADQVHRHCSIPASDNSRAPAPASSSRCRATARPT